MWKRRWISVAGFLLFGYVLVQIVSPLWGQPKADASKSDASPAEDQQRDLEIRYAQAYLNLMEATLGKYQEINRKEARTIGPAVIEGIQDAVRERREQVQLAQSDDTADSQVYVSSAQADLRLAEQAVRSALAAKARSALAVSDSELARLKAQEELAKIRVERASHLASESPLANVRYELELLREDVQELQLRVSLLRTRN